MKTSTRRFLRVFKTSILTAIASVIALLFTLPTIWMTVSAIRPSDEIFRYLAPLSLHAVLPTRLISDNFANLLNGPFLQAIINSIFVCIVTVAGGMIVSTMAAFALSAIQFRYRELVFGIVVICFLIPFDAIAIPLSSLFREWQLRDSYAGLILPGLANGMAIFLLRQFFLGIPTELREAAQVDGANWWTILLRIYVPLARPALIGASLIFFVGQWQSFLWPLLIVSDSSMKLAPIALSEFMGQYNFDFGQLFAGAFVLSVIPIVILLPLQRYFTQSVAATGSKT
jgi:putative chitobiose transport system permease protein